LKSQGASRAKLLQQIGQKSLVNIEGHPMESGVRVDEIDLSINLERLEIGVDVVDRRVFEAGV